MRANLDTIREHCVRHAFSDGHCCPGAPAGDCPGRERLRLEAMAQLQRQSAFHDMLIGFALWGAVTYAVAIGLAIVLWETL